jgi:alpha-L-fucosidase
VSHALLTGGTVDVRQTERGIEIRVPEEDRDPLDTIIALELDGPAAELKPARVDWGPLTFARPATASHTFDHDPRNAWRYAPAKAVDGDRATAWAVNPEVRSAWLEVDLQKETTFNRAWIDEPLGRVKEFQLEVQDGGVWKAFHQGGRMGAGCAVEFPPTTGRRVRLHLKQCSASPVINEFHLFPAPAAGRRADAVEPKQKEHP